MVLAAVASVRSFANRERRPPRAGRIRPAPPGGANRNNRVDPSPYYPVFGRRMVMIACARRPRTRREPPSMAVPGPSAGPRAAHGRSLSSRLVRLRPVRNPASAGTAPPADNPPLRRHGAWSRKKSMRIGCFSSVIMEKRAERRYSRSAR